MLFSLLIINDAMSLPISTANANTQKKLSLIEINRVAEKARDLFVHDQIKGAEELLGRFLHWPYQINLLPLLRMRAELFKRNNNFVDEAATYQQILQFLPGDRAALRGRAFAASHMGALHLAAKYADQHPEAFSQSELLWFDQASAGKSIKWGAVESKAGLGQQRFQSTDKALLQNDALLNHHVSEHKSDSPSARFTEFDRIVALRDRVRMQEAIALYQILKQRGIDIQAYALTAVADAYLYQRQPKLARDLYLQALDSSKNDRDYPNREWQLKLFDAYVDSNEFAAACELIDHLVDTIPPVLNRGLRGVEVDNEIYEQARTDQIRSRLYADQLNEGQELLEMAQVDAPFNLDLRHANGDLLQLREQPRAAQRQYASVLVDDPGNSSAAAGIAETAITLNDGQTAEQKLDTLIQHYPEDREVQRLQRLYHAYSQPLFTVTSGWGRSPSGGGNRGNQNWQVDTLLHSPLLDHHWRVFTHAFNAEADFNTDAGIRRRIGIGADYRSPDWRISGEINQDQTRLDNYGATLDTAWTPNDHWQVDAKFESNSNNIPLQASAANIRMRSVELGVNYIHNESRSLGTSIGYSWLSDGNRRVEAGMKWQERWWSGSTYKLDTVVNVTGSDNSLANADYFNPRNDFSIDAQMINEWTLWQKYQRSFKHRVVLGAGEYWQQGFASGITNTVRYEQELNLDSFHTLNYGVAYERHPYDGQLNESTSVFLNLTWHL